ncbi:phage head closure protein [Rhodovulum kholense]|uniref:SPP1 family predicted phage head-tail adaptor n=1 Tax=Rhodovulum kholense TaxID=453584 RepID=A0A8E2VH41_9RHOB|nr:phage head closure protein [Rhodovulum kholense]PTW43900.1 SPP1 family predicted phage head-tail adaptor [Rhodovulum kholense]
MARGLSGPALDQRVTIERLSRTPDGMGGATESWAPVATVWAQVLPLRGAETWEAMRVSPATRMKVRIRWQGGAAGQPFCTPADRLVWRGRAYNIESALPHGGRERFIEIGISEGVS